MVLNYIWIAFFIVAFVMALVRTFVWGDLQVWSEIMSASFTSAATAFEIALGLTGILSLWLGLMKIGESAGVSNFFGRLVSPLFTRLFPGVPKGHPAMGSIFMNVSANMLGLDNAATPLGLKAMQELQTLNKQKDTATDAMIMIHILNASGLCFIPISIMMYRAQAGAANPTDKHDGADSAEISEQTHHQWQTKSKTDGILPHTRLLPPTPGFHCQNTGQAAQINVLYALEDHEREKSHHSEIDRHQDYKPQREDPFDGESPRYPDPYTAQGYVSPVEPRYLLGTGGDSAPDYYSGHFHTVIRLGRSSVEILPLGFQCIQICIHNSLF